MKDFAHQAESIFKNSDRRTDLDRAYVKMVRVVYEEIGRMAQEQQKTPKDVVMFGRITIIYHVYVVQIITINIKTLQVLMLFR